jgi:glycerol-3-phosphate acyltransferase PlsY
MANITAISLVVGAYLYGSAPFIWGIAKLKGVDLHEFGSRNIGGSNLTEAAGLPLGLIGSFLDLSKGLLPILLGYYAFHQSTIVVCFAGLVAILGQMWPVSLKFYGGRGISATGGAALVWLFTPYLPLKVAIAAIPIGVGAIWRILTHRSSDLVPLGTLATFALFPVLVWIWGNPVERAVISLTFVAAFCLTAIRRLTADLRRDLREKPDSVSLKSILINRFFFDRSYR